MMGRHNRKRKNRPRGSRGRRRASRDGCTSTLALVVGSIHSRQFTHADESELQRGLAQAFAEDGLDAQREVRLSQRDRIDFLVGAVGIEVKVKGSAAKVLAQLERYAESDLIDELVLVTSRIQAAALSGEVGGKPLRVVPILGGLA